MVACCALRMPVWTQATMQKRDCIMNGIFLIYAQNDSYRCIGKVVRDVLLRGTQQLGGAWHTPSGNTQLDAYSNSYAHTYCVQCDTRLVCLTHMCVNWILFVAQKVTSARHTRTFPIVVNRRTQSGWPCCAHTDIYTRCYTRPLSTNKSVNGNPRTRSPDRRSDWAPKVYAADHRVELFVFILNDSNKNLTVGSSESLGPRASVNSESREYCVRTHIAHWLDEMCAGEKCVYACVLVAEQMTGQVWRCETLTLD